MTMPPDERLAALSRGLGKARLDIDTLRVIVFSLLDALAESDPEVWDRTQRTLERRLDSAPAEELLDSGFDQRFTHRTAISLLKANLPIAAND